MPKRQRISEVPQRGEIWIVNFNSPITANAPQQRRPKSEWPTTGDEIAKPRPAVVMNVSTNWELDLSIVVPFRSWKPNFEKHNYFWIVHLPKDEFNKLRGDSGANTFQVKSVSRERFLRKIGVLKPDQLQLIADTIAFCIGYSLPKSTT